MANFEIVALDPTTPQLRAPGAGDNYTLPRPIAGANITLTVAGFAGTLVLSSADNGKFFEASSGDLYLPDVTSVPSGYNVTVKNTSSGVGSIWVYSVGAPQYIDGLTGIALRPLESFTFVSTGSVWRTIGSPIWASSMHSLSYSRPSATNQFAMAFGVAASASGAYSVALGYASNTSNSASFAGPLCSATGSYSLSLGGTSSGSGSYATASGAIALGGRASGSSSMTLGVDTNSTSYGAASTQSTAIGYYSKATASYSSSFGRQAISQGVASIAIGNGYNVSGPNALGSSSVAIGDGPLAAGSFSVALGGGPRASSYGEFAYASGFFGNYGDAQGSKFILRRYTDTNSANDLTTDSSSANGTNQIWLYYPGTAIAFKGIVVAKTSSGTGVVGAWEISGLLSRGASYATTVLHASTVTPIFVTGGSGLNVTLNVDLTYGTLRVIATGISGVGVRWTANVDTALIVL